jgi:hypothetical protein
MYRIVVERSACPAASCIARAGAPAIASREPKVWRKMWRAPGCGRLARFCATAIQVRQIFAVATLPSSQQSFKRAGIPSSRAARGTGGEAHQDRQDRETRAGGHMLH